MPYTVLQTGPTFSYSFDILNVDYGDIIMTGSGIGLLFDEEGALIDGVVENLTLTAVYNEDLNFPDYGFRFFTDVALDVSDLDQASDRVDALYLEALFAGSDIFQALSTGADKPYIYQAVGSDDAVIDGSELFDVIEVSGDGAVVNSGAGRDSIASTGFGVTVNAGGAADRVVGTDADDVIRGQGGHDDLFGGAGNDRLIGGAGRDEIYGGDDNDHIFGGAGADVIDAGQGRDVMNGGAGRDLFKSVGGDNRLTGGADADAFVFVVPNGGGVDQGERSTGKHIITDFDLSEDVLWLGPSLNGTYDVEDSFALIMEGAVQRGANLLLKFDGLKVSLRGVELDDFTIENVTDASNGGYYDWADA